MNLLAEGIGWALFHSFWEGAIVAAALAASRLVIRSPRARYAAAGVALLVMVAAFVLTVIHLMPGQAQGIKTTSRPAFPAWRMAQALNAVPSQNSLSAIIPWLTPLWLAGVCIFCLRHLVGWISVLRLRRRGVCAAPAQWQNTLARLRTQLRLSRPVLLLESCLADTPMVLGHIRPVILIPLGLLAGLPANQIEAILLHELAHIRRHDYLVNLCQRLVESLMFYHPAVWWISRVMRTERENCCDDLVVALCGDAHGYAVALTALEQNRWSAPEPALAATGGNLMRRIHRLLYPKGPAGAWPSFAAAILLMASATIAIAAWPSQSTQPVEHFDTWLNQEVVYIINDQERTAFQKLTSDAERQQFVKQFWERRDPTPGTLDNEFKKEHYRRVAYANAHFETASGKPGWQADRGRMYILYGAPDEIDAFPSGNAQTSYPFEMWRYNSVAGIGQNVYLTFIDRNNTRDYELGPGKVL